MRSVIAGQYIEGDSPIHRLDPRPKIALLFSVVIFLLLWPSFVSHLIVLVSLLLITFTAKIPSAVALGFFKGARFFILITFMVHLLFTPGAGGYDWWIIHLSFDGVRSGLFYGARLFALIWIAALMGWTTAPVNLADGSERMLKPLSRIGLPIRDIVTTMLLAMRFLPTLLLDARELKLAQQARGASFKSGSPISRIKSVVPLVVPLFVGALRRAETTATALTIRGYQSKSNRTSLYPLKLRGTDYLAFSFSVAIITLGIVFANFQKII